MRRLTRSNNRPQHLLAVAIVASLLSATAPIISSTESSTTTSAPGNTTAAAMTTTAKVNETTTTTTTTTTTPTTVATSTVTSLPSTTTSEPRKNIEEVKKIIQQHIDPNRSEHRLAVNKPTSAPPMADFAPESIEARVAEATTQFGLSFMNNLVADDPKSNVVLSPLSLQNLLNMLLLGATDGSATESELTRLLGYDSAHLMDGGRLGPHEAMRSVFQSILAATHLSLGSSNANEPDQQLDLLNTNADSLQQTNSSTEKPSLVRAHLQTSVKEGEQPLSGQLNFTLANLVLTNSDLVGLKPDYEKDLKSYYSVNVEQFSRDNKSAGSNVTSQEIWQQQPLHERVNRWVKNQTQGQIERLADAGDLDGDDLAMILLNAAHFKARWLHTFNPKATHDGTFYNGGHEDGASRAQFMRQKAVFGYADFGTVAAAAGGGNFNDFPTSESKTRASDDSETLLTEDAGKSYASESVAARTSSMSSNEQKQQPTIELSKEETRRLELTGKLNCSALMLPFSLNDGQELSIVLLLPAKRDGLGELQAALSGPALGEIYKSISEQQVQVELPKFAFEASHDAKATLERMGLKSVFQSAHLDRMFAPKTNATNAKVDKVIHKAKIMVDESGAEAAAASMATIVVRNFIRPPTPIFVADHPFLFVIRHNRSNMPLFMGRVASL